MGNESAGVQQPDSIDSEPTAEYLKTQLESMTLLNNTYLKEIKDLQKQKEYLNFRIRSSLIYAAEQAKRNDVERFRSSYSFRVGETIVDAVSKPGLNTILMPFRIIKLMFEFISSRKSS
ncbi:MAG: hypothetical protein GY729_06810 [Desulfobacteraceae bacterium]|nr:hypothetical protein [Desulfobacteraceae bacterium]